MVASPRSQKHNHHHTITHEDDQLYCISYPPRSPILEQRETCMSSLSTSKVAPVMDMRSLVKSWGMGLGFARLAR